MALLWFLVGALTVLVLVSFGLLATFAVLVSKRLRQIEPVVMGTHDALNARLSSLEPVMTCVIANHKALVDRSGTADDRLFKLLTLVDGDRVEIAAAKRRLDGNEASIGELWIEIDNLQKNLKEGAAQVPAMKERVNQAVLLVEQLCVSVEELREEVDRLQRQHPNRLKQCRV